jgi:hypothetical protein
MNIKLKTTWIFVKQYCVNFFSRNPPCEWFPGSFGCFQSSQRLRAQCWLARFPQSIELLRHRWIHCFVAECSSPSSTSSLPHACSSCLPWNCFWPWNYMSQDLRCGLVTFAHRTLSAATFSEFSSCESLM